MAAKLYPEKFKFGHYTLESLFALAWPPIYYAATTA
jgi:hypothetical protein